MKKEELLPAAIHHLQPSRNQATTTRPAACIPALVEGSKREVKEAGSTKKEESGRRRPPPALLVTTTVT